MISIIGSPAQFSQQLLGGFLGNQETMVATPLGHVGMFSMHCWSFFFATMQVLKLSKVRFVKFCVPRPSPRSRDACQFCFTIALAKSSLFAAWGLELFYRNYLILNI